MFNDAFSLSEKKQGRQRKNRSVLGWHSMTHLVPKLLGEEDPAKLFQKKISNSVTWSQLVFLKCRFIFRYQLLPPSFK